MIWKNGLTISESIRRKESWHIWFAWYPVVIDETEDGHSIKAWLQRVERKGTWGYDEWDYSYKLIERMK